MSFLRDFVYMAFLNHLPDEPYIKLRYYMLAKKKLDLKNPKTLCEKLNWLKLHYRKPEYSLMVDKYEVKRIIANKIGEEYIIPSYGVYDSFDEIDFDELPNQFVLKCTHDSGSIVRCLDKSTFDLKAAKEKLEAGLRQNLYMVYREWPYKNVKPRIIAEKYMDGLGKPESVEYKTTCFNGKLGFVTICTGIPHVELEKRQNDHFDRDFNRLDFWTYYKPAKKSPEKPLMWDEIIAVSEKISEGIPYLRVDTYVIDGRLYFGEATFYTWAGFMVFNPPEWDRKLGDMLELPKENFQ